MGTFFSRSRRFRRDIKVKLDLSNYATKTDLKNVTHEKLKTVPAIWLSDK